MKCEVILTTDFFELHERTPKEKCIVNLPESTVKHCKNCGAVLKKFTPMYELHKKHCNKKCAQQYWYKIKGNIVQTE